MVTKTNFKARIKEIIKGDNMDLQQDSALKRLVFRTLWNVIALLITSVVMFLTDNYTNAAWYPVVLFALTTLKDLVNRKLPNLPESK